MHRRWAKYTVCICHDTDTLYIMIIVIYIDCCFSMAGGIVLEIADLAYILNF